MSKATQRGKILAYCSEHGSITVRDAVVKLNINSPTKRISELRQDGYDVQTQMETRVKDDGEVVRYNRYYIKEASDG
jgi:predicted ArsR family transcriptional regulator